MKNSANIVGREQTAPPAPAGTVGSFREWPVSAGLQPFFSAVWLHEIPQERTPPIIVAPDGTIDLQWIDGRFRVAGPDKEANTEFIPAGTTVIGFRFRPAAAVAWLRIPASELVGARPSLHDLWGTKAARLSNRITKSLEDGNAISAIEAVLAMHAADGPIDAAMSAAHALINAGPPAGVPLVPWLARSLAMSERTLRRRFDESYGYGPKTLERILRHQRFLRLSRTAQSSTAVMAAEVGYSDQAHLVRESRRLVGVTPQAYRRIESRLCEQT